MAKILNLEDSTKSPKRLSKEVVKFLEGHEIEPREIKSALGIELKKVKLPTTLKEAEEIYGGDWNDEQQYQIEESVRIMILNEMKKLEEAGDLKGLIDLSENDLAKFLSLDNIIIKTYLPFIEEKLERMDFNKLNELLHNIDEESGIYVKLLRRRNALIVLEINSASLSNLSSLKELVKNEPELLSKWQERRDQLVLSELNVLNTNVDMDIEAGIGTMDLNEYKNLLRQARLGSSLETKIIESWNQRALKCLEATDIKHADLDLNDCPPNSSSYEEYRRKYDAYVRSQLLEDLTADDLAFLLRGEEYFADPELKVAVVKKMLLAFSGK